jgi:hypothetical protein
MSEIVAAVGVAHGRDVQGAHFFVLAAKLLREFQCLAQHEERALGLPGVGELGGILVQPAQFRERKVNVRILLRRLGHGKRPRESGFRCVMQAKKACAG